MNKTLYVVGSCAAGQSKRAELLARSLLSGLLLLLLLPAPSHADLRLQRQDLRTSVSAATVLGDDAPETFNEYGVALSIGLPWESYAESGWGGGLRLLVGAGVLSGAGERALIVSLIPGVALGSRDSRFYLDLGAGGAWLSRSRFGTQDYGGPFQFALTAGAGVPLYRRLGAGYRFLHYSDAGINGSDTTGADLHMVEISYRF